MPKTKILVVEDERIVALNLKQCLVRMGYEVTTIASSGQGALASIAENRPDIVIMDIHLDGDMDGIDTAAAIAPELHLPVVYLTAYADEATLERARRTQPYGFLVKPFSERELQATMTMILERRRADGLLRDSEAQLEAVVAARTAELAVANERLREEISERRRSESQLRMLVDNATEHAIYMVSPEGNVATWNSGAERAKGYAADEIVGQHIRCFFDPEAAAAGEPERILAQAVKEGRSSAEGWRRHKDGTRVWAEVSIEPIYEDGAFVGFAKISQDLTRRKLIEDELRLAKLAADEAVNAKSEFLANMSHELRTPLTSIVGFTRLAAEQADLQGLTRTYVERVGEASRALLCTVNDILDFSKLEVGQVSFQLEPTSLAKLGRATLNLFMPQAGAKDLDLVLDCEVEASDLMISLDPDRIRQILLNLVGNAVKFTDSGMVTLRTRYDGASGMLSIDVIDTGPGIPPDRHDRLFQRFSQVDGSLSRAHGGTGLGLAICKGLVEAMGGEIGAESRAGEGSRFWFTIPAPLVDAASALIDGPNADQSTFIGVRVLVVDDHPTNRELARLILAGIGAEVSEAADGEEAAQLASEWPYDVILMDLRMPKLDGAGALQRIRMDPGPNDATPILAFTADANSETAGRLASMGFQDVVAKPLEPGTLIAAVARATAFWQDQPPCDQSDPA